MQPPDSVEDFTTDAKAFADAPVTEFGNSPGLEPALTYREFDTIDQLEAELAKRKAALERRSDVPEVIDATGQVVATTEDSAPVWPHQVIEIQGKQVQVKTPSAAAIRYLGVFAFGDHGVKNGDFQDFMTRHVSPKTIDDIRTWTYADEIDEGFYDQLMKKLTTMGTNRPTVPSSASQRSR